MMELYMILSYLERIKKVEMVIKVEGEEILIN